METLLRAPFRNLIATPGSARNGELAVKIGSINDPADESIYAAELDAQRLRLQEYDDLMKAKLILSGREEQAEAAEPFKYDEKR